MFDIEEFFGKSSAPGWLRKDLDPNIFAAGTAPG